MFHRIRTNITGGFTSVKGVDILEVANTGSR
jgi:hypothetical protein